MGSMVDTPQTVHSTQEGGRVAVVCNMVPVVANLSIPELLTERVAEIVGTIEVRDALRLVRGRGD